MNTELIAYYTNLLIIQYIGKPKARATISALITILMIYDLIIQVRDGYDPNSTSTVGKQLDILGKYIGVDRVISGLPLATEHFGYILYSDTPPVAGITGYVLYADTPPAGAGFLTYFDGLETYTLTDAEFLKIIQLAIMRNSGDASIKQIHEIMTAAFGTEYLVIDVGNMNLVYKVQSDFLRLAQLMEGEGLFPKPMGVGISIIVEDTLST